MSINTELGWYGKLPTAGDFLHRHLPEPQMASWSHWFNAGIAQWQQQHNGCSEAFARAPVWNFALPATLGVQRVQTGCLIPSRDRVGRLWPLLVVYSIPAVSWPTAQQALSSAWFQSLGSTLCTAVRQSQSVDWLAQAIAALPPPSALPHAAPTVAPSPQGSPHIAPASDRLPSSRLTWQDVARRFEPLRYASYWWTNQSDGAPPISHRHSGNLTAQLFTQLFHPTVTQHAGRHGLYPPMFDQAD